MGIEMRMRYGEKYVCGWVDQTIHTIPTNIDERYERFFLVYFIQQIQHIIIMKTEAEFSTILI